MKPFVWLMACTLAGGAPAPASAQPSTPSLNGSGAGSRVALHLAVEAAWQRSLASAEARGQRLRAEAERVAAGSLWAAPPALELHQRSDRWQRHSGQRETEVALAWPLWLPGQRAARGAAAESGIVLATLADAAAQWRIAGEVREAAWSLREHEAEAAQADAIADALETLSQDVDRRVRAGELARADALAARAEWLSASVQQSESRQRLRTARGRWKLLTGLEAMPAVETAAIAAAPSTPELLAGHPERRLAEGIAEQARLRLDGLRHARREAPELTIGMRQDTPGHAQPSQGSLAIGLRIAFGTQDRYRPLEADALAALELARVGEQRVSERLLADAEAARGAAQTAEQQLDAERQRAALLRDRARLIDKSFRAGESPLPDLLRALAAAAQAESALARQQAALGLARARLQQALGVLP